MNGTGLSTGKRSVRGRDFLWMQYTPFSPYRLINPASAGRRREMELVVTPELEAAIATKISEAVQSAYYGAVAQAINKALNDKLLEEGTIKRIVEAVYKKICLTEDEYVEKIATDIKKGLLSVSTALVNETLKKVEEKVKSYGFIQIGR
jgi:hypothetical protein